MDRLLPLLLLLTACPAADLPDALVAADRSGHWLDRPFPSDELLVDGFVDWTILPETEVPLATTITSGWAAQAAASVTGFSHQSTAFFRFSEVFEIAPGQVGITGPDGLDVPVEWRWVEDPMGDPFLAANTLLITPEPTAPLASGSRHVAWVDGAVADPAEGWEPPDGAPEDVAVATAFTVQDSLGQLRGIFEAVESSLDDDPDLLQVEQWRMAISLTCSQGQTPSGRDATVATVVYEDGDSEQTFLAPREGEPEHSWDLGEAWPFEVWEGRIRTLAFQDPAGRPWASPGILLVNDFDRIDEGWLHFDGATLLDEPVAEEMRIVVQVPRDGDSPFPVVTWDHGTGGHAWNAVARSNFGDRSEEVAAALSGAVVVSRDQPLYGQRYPLIDEGFGASVGFYNIGNLPAFRDNQRQAAADHRVLHRFVVDALPDLVDVDTDRIGAFGHSLGSVTLHGAQAGADGAGASTGFYSGTGGYLGFYILESGLLGTGNDVVATIAPLLGLTEEQVAEAEPYELVAALVGLPEAAWPNLQRDHPTMQLFGAIMDPSDPLMFAADQVAAETILLGVGDLQVPDRTTRWLAEVTPDAELIECTPTADYDGHWCLFREDEGIEALRSWAARLAQNR